MKSSFVFVAVLLLSACSTQPVLTSQVRAGTELGAYRSFAFKPSAGVDANGNVGITSAHVRAAISKEMTERRYIFSEVNPDIWVDFNTSIVSRPKKSSAPTINIGMFGSNGGVSIGVPVSGAGNKSNMVSRIGIELLDIKRKEVIWEGVYEGALSEQDLANPSANIYPAVHSIFSRFPIK